MADSKLASAIILKRYCSNSANKNLTSDLVKYINAVRAHNEFVYVRMLECMQANL